LFEGVFAGGSGAATQEKTRGRFKASRADVVDDDFRPMTCWTGERLGNSFF
jgi:hypothetical protein